MKQKRRRYFACLLAGALAVTAGWPVYAAEGETPAAAEQTEVSEAEAPASENPETEAMAAENPATEAPAAETPATEAPASENPETEAPAAENPATEAPASENPATEAPAAENPETEAPAAENPATEVPVAENPATEAPAAENPETEISITEAPAETQTETQPETTAETQLSISFSIVSDVDGICLRTDAEAEKFAKSLYTAEEAARGGKGEVVLYADSAEGLLEDEAQKDEAHALSGQERRTVEAEQEILKRWAADSGYDISRYFVLRLKKGMEGEIPARIYKSEQKLRMILETDSEAEAVLVYAEDGQAVVCGDCDQNAGTVTFDSGSFGTYALAYRRPESENVQMEAADIEMQFSGGAVYRQSSQKIWNPAKHSYEEITQGSWVYEEEENAVVLKNNGSREALLVLSYHPAKGHEGIQGRFVDAEGREVREITVLAGTETTVYLRLSGEASAEMQSETIGTVVYEAVGEEQKNDG